MDTHTIDSGICEDFIKVCLSVIAENKLQIKKYVKQWKYVIEHQIHIFLHLI
jgi:hypothetical protein